MGNGRPWSREVITGAHMSRTDPAHGVQAAFDVLGRSVAQPVARVSCSARRLLRSNKRLQP
jgi:hypothetical protein